MITAIVLISLVSLLILLVGIGMVTSGPRYRGPVSDHFDGRRFINPGGAKARGGLDIIRWMMHRRPGPWTEDRAEHYGKHPLGHFREGIRITWVNHSTFLIQVDGLNILTDPVWSKRVSPFRWIGPRRMKLPGLRFGDLPRIDVVVLSHNHYDHLDLETMHTVFAACHPRIIAPLGVKRFLERNYLAPADELDWWEKIEVSDQVTVQSVPAQHFSGRGLLDRDATLWCGYVIRTTAGNIYFAADTGYNQPMFKEIRRKCGPFRLSLLPIGSYKPSWFMSPIHGSPEEAVKAHLDIESETSIAMHFGTFRLGDDGEDEPVTDLNEAIKQYQLPPDAFVALREGEFRVFE